MTPRLNIGKGVTGAVRYVLGEGRDPKTGELKPAAAHPDLGRVDWISGQNLGFRIVTAADAELARRVMEFDALNQRSRTRQCENDCVHLSLGWKPGDNPSRQEMEDAAQAALQALGMGNAKALFVAHRDGEHAHVHIVASKINPDTGRAYDLAGSFRTLSRWAQEYELAHGGILCTRREGANELRDAIADRNATRVLAALTKQRATFTESQLHRALEKEIIGPSLGKARETADIELARFHADVLANPQLVQLSTERDGSITHYTTRTVLEAERRVLRAATELIENDRHRIGILEKAAVRENPRFAGMTAEQERAFHRATGAEGLTIIDGQAGTGKSYTIAAIREAYEASGYNVIGLAFKNDVVEAMRTDGFKHAATIHSETFALNIGRRHWDSKTVVLLDEAAMVDTKLMALVTAHAADAGAKLILAGDDRQLSSINHGGMFAVLIDRHGAAEISEVKRQHKNDERRASEMFASGNFHDALNIYDGKGAIHWSRTQRDARAELIEQWAKDSAAAPEKSRFVFAYTNAAVSALNTALRDVRKERGELGDDHQFATAYGQMSFAAGDRIQFAATDKKLGIVNGAAGIIDAIEGSRVTVTLDGRPKTITFDADTFDKFRHGYAGTIYKGQGRTLDETMLYHSEHWRSASSYVAMTRHRDKAALFVARNTAKDVKQLARQMGRTDDRRAASMFYARQELGPMLDLTPAELNAWLSPRDAAEQRAKDRPAPIAPNEREQDAILNAQRNRDRLNPQDLQDRVRAMPERYDDLHREHRSERDRDDEAERDRSR